VADREAGHPFLLGTLLLGERLPVPPPPGPGFVPLAVDDAGRGLVYTDGQSLYLPPLSALVDRPFFPRPGLQLSRPPPAGGEAPGRGRGHDPGGPRGCRLRARGPRGDPANAAAAGQAPRARGAVLRRALSAGGRGPRRAREPARV